MFRLLNKIKGQSTLEYAVLIIIIIGALLSIQVYIKRGVQGRLKQASDDIGDQFSVGNTNAVYTTTTHAQTAELFGVAKQGVSTSSIIGSEITNTTTNLELINAEQEFWGK